MAESELTATAHTPAPTSTRQVPFEVIEDGELVPRRKNDDEPNRQVVTAQSFSNTSFHGTLKTVYYGTYNHRPACILALQFVFCFQPGIPRFKSADITITFEKTKTDNTAAVQQPTVKAFCPRKVYAQVSEESRKWSFGISLLLGPGPVQVQPSAQVESAYPRQHRMEIRGLPLAAADGARWSIAENAKQKSGIPDVFPCAILVVYDGEPFQASVEVKVRTNSVFSLLARPWSRDDPVLLHPNTPLGQPLLDPQLERMTNADWEQFVKFSEGTIETFLS